MKHRLPKSKIGAVLGLSLMGLTATGCGTLTGAAIGGATGAGIGAATRHSVQRSAIIGAGVGAAGGALYDLYSYNRRRDRDRYDYD